MEKRKEMEVNKKKKTLIVAGITAGVVLCGIRSIINS